MNTVGCEPVNRESEAGRATLREAALMWGKRCSAKLIGRMVVVIPNVGERK